MAYAQDLSLLSKQDYTIIKSLLCLKPTTKKTKFQRNESEPVDFYNETATTIHLPFLFAAAFFKNHPNFFNKFPSTNLNFTGTLKDNQIPVADKAWEQLQKLGTSTLGLYPGFGKTILGAKLASNAKLMTVILVHREILTVQWKTTFNQFTNATVWIVGEKNPPDVCDVIVCMDTRWYLIPEHTRDNIGFLIIDEAHAFCTPARVGCLLAFHPKFILAESATLERDDGMHSMIYSICGSHGVMIESQQPFTVYKTITNCTPVRKTTRQGTIDWHSLVESTLFDDRRNSIILNIIKQLPEKTFLILTSLVDHALLLNKLLTDNGISSDYMCGVKKSYTEATVLVGTTSKIGTGFDQASICPTFSGKRFDVLILACSIKKYATLVQNVGRVFRATNPTIFHLVDNDSIFVSHWYLARKWYLARGGNVTNYDIPNLQQSPSTPTTTDNWIKSKIIQLKINKSPQHILSQPTNPLPHNP